MRLKFLSLLAVMLLVAAGCSSSDSTVPDASTSSTQASASATSTSTSSSQPTSSQDPLNVSLVNASSDDVLVALDAFVDAFSEGSKDPQTVNSSDFFVIDSVVVNVDEARVADPEVKLGDTTRVDVSRVVSMEYDSENLVYTTNAVFADADWNVFSWSVRVDDVTHSAWAFGEDNSVDGVAWYETVDDETLDLIVEAENTVSPFEDVAHNAVMEFFEMFEPGSSFWNVVSSGSPEVPVLTFTFVSGVGRDDAEIVFDSFSLKFANGRISDLTYDELLMTYSGLLLTFSSKVIVYVWDVPVEFPVVVLDE